MSPGGGQETGPPPGPWRAGLLCRCPECGRGPLFEGFLSVREHCLVCGFPLAREDSGDGPAAFIILIVGAIVVGLVLVVEVRYAPPVWLHVVIWLPLTVLLCLALMRPGKSLLIALQHRHRRHDFGHSA